MIAQLQAQDPLQPANTNEYLSELAQFTQVEQITNLANASELSGGDPADRPHRLLQQPRRGHRDGQGPERAVDAPRARRSPSKAYPASHSRASRKSDEPRSTNPALIPPGGAGERRPPPAGSPSKRPPASGACLASPQALQQAGGSAATLQFSSTRSRRVQRRGIELDAATLRPARRGRRPRRAQGLARLTRSCRRHRIRGVRQQPHRDHGGGIRAHEGQRVHQHRQCRDRMSVPAAGNHGRTSSRRPRKDGQSR